MFPIYTVYEYDNDILIAASFLLITFFLCCKSRYRTQHFSVLQKVQSFIAKINTRC